jgi:hypothetical protein
MIVKNIIKYIRLIFSWQWIPIIVPSHRNLQSETSERKEIQEWENTRWEVAE